MSVTSGQVRTAAGNPDWKRFQIVEAVSVNVGRLIRWGFTWGIFRYGYFSILALSGKQTLATFVLQFLGSLNVQVSIYLCFAVSGIAWGTVERVLRKRTIKTSAKRIRYLERLIDPKRSSSKLMEDGSTRPEDEER